MIDIFQHIAHEAATEILKVYGSSEAMAAEHKSDGSPLTEADSRAHRVIVDGLNQAFPDLPILSEEGSDIPWSERQGWERFFLVDPLDGTREFINRNGDFTVNIALVERGVPTVGIVHIPVSGISYAAVAGQGAFRIDANSRVRLKVSPSETSHALRVVGSRSHASEELGAFLELLPGSELTSRGSALKLCLVAEGSAEVYPRHGLTSLWDIAAGHCVITEAGGFVCDARGNDLRYGRGESVRNPPFVAGAFDRMKMAQLFAQSLGAMSDTL